MTDQEKKEQLKKMSDMAKEILVHTRNTLLVKLRFLDAALSQFRLTPDYKGSFSTDGLHLFFNPQHVLSTYLAEKEITARDYLHVVFHCIYQHMYSALNLQRGLWNIACDIAVEATITGLGLDITTAKREETQKEYFAMLEEKIGTITAEKVYRYLLDEDLSINKLQEIGDIFWGDDHTPWYEVPEDVPLDSVAANTNEAEEDNREDQEKADLGIRGLRSRQSQSWMDVASRLHMQMENFAKKRGKVAGDIIQNLQELNVEKYDYSSFLKKFAVLGEVMKIDDDAFDYIFYTYGLKLYDKMPLIEPLENKEVKRIKEFVIAIDTSGSVRGEIVQAFVQKTYNILKSSESFFTKMNLHIIQCDANIQDHVKITSQGEFDEYIKTMKIKGLGGTDFRPVFQMVDEMIMKKEFSNLGGLIYFTDGHGIFPARRPKYQTAFVFLNDGNHNPDIPSWGIRLMLNKEEIQKDSFKL